jgi:hypothetical protein
LLSDSHFSEEFKEAKQTPQTKTNKQKQKIQRERRKQIFKKSDTSPGSSPTLQFGVAICHIVLFATVCSR